MGLLSRCSLLLLLFSGLSFAQGLRLVPVLNPCRVIDTRIGSGTFGAPYLPANSTRALPIRDSSCGIPAPRSATPST